MIDRSSRYKQTATYIAVDAQGEPLKVLELRDISKTESVFAHSPEPGQRLDHLAQRYYRDARKFWRICDASDEMDPFDVVQPGVPVRIPPDR
ncbi:MAG TPA: hypothetical protein VNM90_01345 [Haliangium sp.]|nr:hypothetical protein [Haliangium sp.]